MFTNINVKICLLLIIMVAGFSAECGGKKNSDVETVNEYRAELKQHFGYLETDFGFSLRSFTDEPRAFNNFYANYSRPPVEIRIMRDRGQVFVELKYGDGEWQHKEGLLADLGVPSSRFPTHKPDEYGGFWTGYHIENQSTDLKEHLPKLIEHLARTAGRAAPPNGNASTGSPHR
jgi:hypothetical protein